MFLFTQNVIAHDLFKFSSGGGGGGQVVVTTEKEFIHPAIKYKFCGLIYA
jgi:hypothetical protein